MSATEAWMRTGAQGSNVEELVKTLNSNELLRLANVIESSAPHHPPFPDRPSPSPSHPPFASEGEVLLPGVYHVQISSEISFNGSTFTEDTLKGIIALAFVGLFVGLILFALCCRNDGRENRSYWLTMMNRANEAELYARDMQKRLTAMEANRRKRLTNNAVHEEWKRHVKERQSEQLAMEACERQRAERDRLEAELEGQARLHWCKAATDSTPNGKRKSLVNLISEVTADADPGGAATRATGGASEAAFDGSSRRSSGFDLFDAERNVFDVMGKTVQQVGENVQKGADGTMGDAAQLAYDIVALNTGEKFASLDEMAFDKIRSPRQSLQSRHQLYRAGSSSVEWKENGDADGRRMAEKVLAVEREMIELGLEATTISDKLEIR